MVPALSDAQMFKTPGRHDHHTSSEGTPMELPPREGVPVEPEVSPSEEAPDGAATSGESDNPSGCPEAQDVFFANVTA